MDSLRGVAPSSLFRSQQCATGPSKAEPYSLKEHYFCILRKSLQGIVMTKIL